MRERGCIISCDAKRRFGFIQSAAGGRDIFIHQDNVESDSLGRRWLTVGSEVEFDLGPATEGRPLQAVNVQHIFADEVADPLKHREVSILTFWNDRTGGFLERESFDCVAIFPEQICDFENVKDQIVVGLWFSHGVARKDDNPDLWYAVDAIPHFDEVPASVEPVESAQQIYTDCEKKMSLKEIIQKRKEAQCHSN